MKRTILLILSIFVISISGQSKYDGNISKVKAKFAPDGRTAIFDVTISEKDGGFVLAGETNIPEAKNMLINLLPDDIDMKDELKVLPEKELGEKIYGVITVSVGNLRTNPRHSAEMATQAILGTPVKVYKKRHGWYQIQTPEGYIAWIDGSGVQDKTYEEQKEWVDSKKIIYLEDYGFCYSEADKKSQRVSDLVSGNLLRLNGENGDFYEVTYPDGRKGFVVKGECKEFDEWYDSIELNADNVLAKAKTYMGVPYMWGGTSTKLLDCSGFTKTVFYHFGWILPRDASQQVFTGELVSEEIDLDKFKKGDLLFFGRKAKDGKKERVTHVGLYIGDGEFIHEAGMVKINSFKKTENNFSEYRFKSFLRAKRIIDAKELNGITNFRNNKFYTGE